jgi:hypothetical protein
MSYVLRVNVDAADHFCCREQERFYWQQLAEAELAPALLWVSEDERYYLSAFIESDRFQSECSSYWPGLERQTRAADFVQGQSLLGHSHVKARFQPVKQAHPNQAHSLLLALLLQLRELPTGPYGISVTEQWQQYHQHMLSYGSSPAVGGSVPSNDWHERVAQFVGIQADIQQWADTLAACLVAPQFCHRDLNPYNLLLHNNRLVCIDFEYATASHPLCELAVVLATHALTPSQQDFLVEEYLKDHPYLTLGAASAVPAAIELYWVFACYWALLMAAQQTELTRSAEYIAWFDLFWPLISPSV